MTITKQAGILLMAIVSLSTVGCTSSREASQESKKEQIEVKSPGVAARPHAIVYRTNGDYANHVPVTLSDDGTTLLSYPDPTDVASGNVTPIALENGYLLDRRGINSNTAYLDYTYEEYAALESAPSVKELMEHIIAKNAITEIYRLPLHASEAIANPSLCNDFVINGFKECKKVK